MNWPYEAIKVPQRKKPVSRKDGNTQKRELRALELAAKRPVTGKELSDMFGMSSTGGNKILYRLKQRGLVEKVGNRHYAATSSVVPAIEPEIKQAVVTPPAAIPRDVRGLFPQLNEVYQEYCSDMVNFADYIKAKRQ